MSDADKVQAILKEATNFDFVRFTVSDIHGIPRTRVIPKEHVGQFMKEGPSVAKGKTTQHRPFGR